MQSPHRPEQTSTPGKGILLIEVDFIIAAATLASSSCQIPLLFLSPSSRLFHGAAPSRDPHHQNERYTNHAQQLVVANMAHVR